MSGVIKPKSAVAALPYRAHAKSSLQSRRLVTVQQGYSYECARCGWQFAQDVNPPKVASLLQIMHFYEARAGKQFAGHRCS
jgi:hypothetical protein